MKYKRVRFLKYINRPPVFVAIEIDTIGVFLFILLTSIFIMSFSSVVNPALMMIISFLSAYILTKYYVKYKNEAPKGYLKHLLYTAYIYRVNYKKHKEEIKRMDISPDKYYPNPNEKLFIE